MKLLRLRRFNGAEAVMPRKIFHFLWSQHVFYSFNGAEAVMPRKIPAWLADTGGYVMLQWGRGSDASEDSPVAGATAKPSCSLQWGRGSDASEDNPNPNPVYIYYIMLQWGRGSDASEDRVMLAAWKGSG